MTTEWPRIYTVAELAEIAGQTVRNMRNHIRRAGVKGTKVGRRWYFNIEELVASKCFPAEPDSATLTVADVAKAIGWPVHRARRFLRRAGVIGTGNRRGQRYRISENALVSIRLSASVSGKEDLWLEGSED